MVFKMSKESFDMEKNDEYHHLLTKIKELESELNQSKSSYQEFKKNFVSSLSHELRTPLNSILGFSKLLVDSGLNQEQKDEYFRYVSLGSERLINLIHEMIQLALINTEKIEPDMNRFNISKMFDEIHDDFTERLSQRPDNNILLIKRKDIDNNNYVVVSDEKKLLQVFNFLLNHVLRNTSNGIVEYGYIFLDYNYIHFFIEDRRDNSYSLVKDILYEATEKDDKELFIDETANYTGFGLTISKMIIEAFGGDIWIKNNDYNGYTINFIIPVNSQAVLFEENSVLENQKTTGSN
jgi:signal transduction histidine kinase